MSAMIQPGLFEPQPQLAMVLADDAEGGIVYRPGFVETALADAWFRTLRDEVPWESRQRPMYDRVVDVPRLVAAYALADPDLPRPLQDAARRLRGELGVRFTAAGLNFYRDGNDSVAPHNDKLHSLVPGHPIALLSLGATRRMTIRGKLPPRHAQHIELASGSLLLMSHESQRHFDHGIPKTRDPVGPRISLAFRVRPQD